MTSHDPGTPPPFDLELTLQPDQPSRSSEKVRWRPKRMVAVSVASVLAVGAGIFGVATMNDTGGNVTPEEAVEAFFDAVDDEDVIGVLESVDPAERASLRRAIEGALREADRAAVTDGVDLDDVQGIDLRVGDLAHESERFTDDIAGVDLTSGTIEADAALADVPLGRTVRDLLDADAADPDSATAELEGIRVMTVRRGDSWYVSGLYTAAEAIRLADDPSSEVPKFGAGTPAVGADSPEDAVRALVRAIDDVDVEAMIAITSPTRAQVLHDYGPVLIAAAGDADPDSIDLTSVKLELAPSSGDTTLVEVTIYELILRGDHETTKHWLADGCLVTTRFHDYEGVDEDGLYLESGDQRFPHKVSTCDEDTGGVGPVWSGLGGIYGVTGDTIVFTTVEEDGRWFIDPLDSLAQTLVGSLEAAPTERLENLVHVWTGSTWLVQPDEFWEACGVDRPEASAGRTAGMEALDSCFRQLPVDYEGGWYNVGPISSMVTECVTGEGEPCDDSEFYEDPIGDCYAEADATAIEACILAEVEAGRLSPADACYSMPDGDTTSACMRRGVEDGTIEPDYACRAELDRERQLACMRDGVDAGTIAADEMAAFECEAVFESVSGGIEAEMEAYDACLAEIPDE